MFSRLLFPQSLNGTHFLILESPPSVEVDTKLAMSTMQSFGLDPYFARSIDLGGKCVKLEKEWHYRAWN